MPLLTREEWLTAMADELRPTFSYNDVPIPAEIRISCGWPSSRALAASGKSRTIGQCWPAAYSADATIELFISPAVGDGHQAAAVLVHELIHAALSTAHPTAGHGPLFRAPALRLGLTGKMTATTAGPKLAERLNALATQIGPYPHAALDLVKAPKQGTRMLKLECPECGYTVRTTQKWIDAGMPTCPCGELLELTA